jgi:glycosyltransferase involved in cell wall biosynthesis
LYYNYGDSKSLDVTFISTYHPTICGIATFTENLRNSLAGIDSSVRANVVAVDSERKNILTPNLPEVVLRIAKDERSAYTSLAKSINVSNTDIVCIQHEFGIFGGLGGRYLLDLMELCERPIVTILHTLNHNLKPYQKIILRRIVKKSDAVVTLLPTYTKDLEEIYGTSNDHHIEEIPHGIPAVQNIDKMAAKAKIGLSGKMVMASFGLINPNKGLEYAIEALPKIIEHHPTNIYLIIGQTHPNIIRKYGEVYRERLEGLAYDLGIEDNVKFINRFLPEDDLSLHLAASDIYVAPYLNRNQTSSGCLVYALAHGMAVISTPYPHSEYELDRSTGILISPHNSGEIAEAGNLLLDKPTSLFGIQKKTIELMKTRQWPNVAMQYTDLFKNVLDDKIHKELPYIELTKVNTTPKTPEQIILRQ